MNAVLSISG
jgi:hypothetical protein